MFEIKTGMSASLTYSLRIRYQLKNPQESPHFFLCMEEMPMCLPRLSSLTVAVHMLMNTRRNLLVTYRWHGNLHAYDKKLNEVDLHVGEHVMVLMPSES